MTVRRVIGFDRELRLEWLDAVAARAVTGDTPKAARNWLDTYLADRLGGQGRSGHRGKTVTVLARIWVNVPPHCLELRDRALQILEEGDASDRLGLHWAMAAAVYPFFADVVNVVGRLLALQGEVERRVVIGRVVESWGDRAAVSRGSRAVWSSVVAWGVLGEGRKRGIYTKRPVPLEVSAPVRGVLLDAFGKPDLARNVKQRPASAPGLFPFFE
jgi:hypothetical protein